MEITDCYPLRPRYAIGRGALAQLARANRDDGTRLAILDAQPEVLQRMGEQLVQAGIEMIWNFSAAPLLEWGSAVIQNESLFPSLGILSGRVRIQGDGQEQ